MVRRAWSAGHLWVAVSVLAPVAETAVVSTVGPRSAAPLGPQVTAPAPLDLFHDLRWVSTRHDSWLTLVVEVLAVVVGRACYEAWVLRAAGSYRGAYLRAVAWLLTFYAVMGLLITPWVSLLFGLAVTHLSYLFLAGVPPALALALATHRGVIVPDRGGWVPGRATASWVPPSPRSLVWMTAAVGWLTVAGALISIAPLSLALAVAAGAGALNAAAVKALTHPGRLPERRRRPWIRLPVPFAIVGTFGVAIGGAAGAFASEPPPVHSAYQEVLPESASGHPVLEMSGFGSGWSPPTALGLPPGYVEWRYSYCGVRPGGLVCPYRPIDTEQSLGRSTAALAEQVHDLSSAYRQPVDIVAESEGAIIAQRWLLDEYRSSTGEVGRVVLLDLPEGQPDATYPMGKAEGWGVGSGRLLSGWAWLVDQVSPLHLSVTAPLFEDFNTSRSALADLARSPAPPGVEEVAINALADALNDPYPSAFPGDPTVVLPVAHGGLMTNPQAHSIIRAFLEGRRVSTQSAGLVLERVIGAASAAWQAPSTP